MVCWMSAIKGSTILKFWPNINGTTWWFYVTYIKSWHHISNSNRICRSLKTFASDTMAKNKCMNEIEAETYSFDPEHYKVKQISNLILTKSLMTERILHGNVLNYFRMLTSIWG